MEPTSQPLTETEVKQVEAIIDQIDALAKGFPRYIINTAISDCLGYQYSKLQSEDAFIEALNILINNIRKAREYYIKVANAN